MINNSDNQDGIKLGSNTMQDGWSVHSQLVSQCHVYVSCWPEVIIKSKENESMVVVTQSKIEIEIERSKSQGCDENRHADDYKEHV